VAGRSEQQLFEDMRALMEGRNSPLPNMVVRRFQHEDRFNDALKAVRAAEDEMTRLQNIAANPFGALASQWVGDRKRDIIATEGARIREQLGDTEAQLGRMLTDVEISKLDMLDFERRMLEQASVGTLEDTRNLVNRKRKVKRGHVYWPWMGEYWADELGYYRVEARPSCPTSLQPRGDITE
jgi:hypothetical protein